MVKFSQDVFDSICERLASGESVRSITSDDDMPSKAAFFKWLDKDENGSLVDQYTRAKEGTADVLFDETLEIADAATNEDVQVARLRIDTRKWMAGKLRPKKYGDKVMNEHSGPDGADIPHSVTVKFGK